MTQRRRMIDPSFWSDPTIAELTIPARLLFLGMVSHADDEGRLEVNVRYIRRSVFGFDDAMTTDDVAILLNEVRAVCRSVLFYEADGRQLAAFTNWKRYQYIQKKQASKLPPPAEAEQDDTDTIPIPSVADSPILSVQPNRIEENRKELNTPTVESPPTPVTEDSPITPVPKPVPDPTLKHPAIVAYRNFWSLTPPPDTRQEIVGTVDKDLDTWGMTMRNWKLAGHKGANVLGQLEWFQKGGRPFPDRSSGRSTPIIEAPPPTKTLAEVQAAARHIPKRLPGKTEL